MWEQEAGVTEEYIMQFTKKRKMIAAILAIAFAAYHVTLFALCGFSGHTAVFWTSWVFMLAAFATITASITVLGQRGMFLRDWLFGFPIIKHSTVFLITELIASGIFILFEKSVSWSWAFAIQFFMLCVYGICAISCFLTKETINEVHTKISDKTKFIKLLRSDVEMLVEKCSDPVAREECFKLAEAIRYSDPMSSEALFELEKDLALTISECDKAVAAQDFTAAKELCAKAKLLLAERNKKCKALK